MKALNWLVPLTLLGTVAAFAAGAYTVNLTTAQENKVNKVRKQLNRETCSRLALPEGCSQAEATAKDPDAEIYSSGEYPKLLKRLALEYADMVLIKQNNVDRANVEIAIQNATPTQKDGICTALGLPASCFPNGS